jgi:L,D-transpeptidase YbiS
MSIHNGITRDRFIYVPGTGYEGKIGSLASHGCVRMRDADVVGRFELVDDGAKLLAEE